MEVTSLKTVFRNIENSLFFTNSLFFWRNFLTGFRRFICEFPIFLKMGSSAEIPLTATECYAYESVSSVESIMLKTIIEAKIGQNGRRSKCAA